MIKPKAILFDRDGVVNYRIVGDYVKNSDEFCFIPDFITFFKFIKDYGYLTLLVTNQQGVGKGIMNEKQLESVFDNMQSDLLKLTASNFDKIYYCTDLAESKSFYRKPNPGMLLEAIEQYKLDLNQSIMIGDSKSDVLAGNAVGLKTILLSPPFKQKLNEPDFIFKNFDEIIANFNKLL